MQKLQKHIFLLAFISFFIFAFSICRAAGPDQKYSVGYKVMDFKYILGGAEKNLTVAVWYPTVSRPDRVVYHGPAKGDIAVNGDIDPKNGPYPLLVFSHGYGGSGLGSVFLTEKLAASGWIVAAPDHNDADSMVRIRPGPVKDASRKSLLSNAQKITNSGPDSRAPYLYRIEEMKAALAQMISSPFFEKHIDRNKIAVGGHSFGGFTALGLCGTIDAYRDERIKAVLLFSTGAGGYLFKESELSRVKIPSMYIYGELEKEQKRGNATMSELAGKIFGSFSAPKYLMVVKGANHFSFNNRFVNTWGSKYFCGTAEQFDVIKKYSIAFLEKYAAGKSGFDATLDSQDPMLVRRVIKK